MARHTELDQIIQSPLTDAQKDSLALYHGVHSMLHEPRLSPITREYIGLPVPAPARQHWPRQARPLDRTVKYTLTPGDELPRAGKALTFWVPTEYASPAERHAVEAVIFKEMKDFCRALRHRYNIPLKAASITPSGPSDKGMGLMGIVFATDAAHADALEHRVLPDISMALAYCDEASPAMQTADSVLCHFPPPRPPQPEIDALRREAEAGTITKHLTPDQAQLAVADLAGQIVGAVALARTDRLGHVHIRKPSTGEWESLPPRSIPYNHTVRGTCGLALWFKPEYVHSLNREQKEAHTLDMKAFTKAIRDQLGFEPQLDPLPMMQRPEPGKVTFGVLLRADKKHEEQLIKGVSEMIGHGRIRALEYPPEPGPAPAR